MPDNITSGASSASVSSGATSSAPAPGTGATSGSAPSNTGAAPSPVNGGQQPQTSSPAPGSPQAQAQQQAQQAAARKLKLKVDGRDEELDEAEVVKWAQMGRAAQQRFQQAAQMRKQAEDFIAMLKKDPKAVLLNPAIGVDVRKFAEEYLAEQLKLETLTPEQKKIREQEDRLKQLEEEKRTNEERAKHEEFQRLQQHYAKDYEQKILDSLNSSGLPRTPYTVKRMTEYMMTALENGIEVEPSNVVQMVRQDYMSDAVALFAQTDGETLLKIMGDDVANKIRKADLARIRNVINAPAPAAPAPEASAQGSDEGMPRSGVSEKKPMNIHEWRAQLEKKVKG